MRILVCGGRDFADRDMMHATLSGQVEHDDIIIHGGCRGADRMAGEWATSRGIHSAEVKALWDFYSRSAGHKRNAAMLWLAPGLVIAFPGGTGTRGMCERAARSGVHVMRVGWV